MFRPPIDPRDRPLVEPPTWRSIVVSYALVAVVLLLLWVVSYPRAGAVILAGIAGLFIGGRRAYRLIRCCYNCEEFSFDLFGRARITVSQTSANEPK